MPFPILNTERLFLCKLTLADADGIFLLRSDKDVNKYLDRPIAKNLGDAKQFINKMNTSISKGGSIFWVINYKAKPKLIGTICL